MRKTFLIIFMIIANASLVGCTKESLEDIKQPVYADDGNDEEENPVDPPEEPPVGE